jgi:hypothetical protein
MDTQQDTHIFNLSLHRCGTQSGHDLFRRAGIKSAHWVDMVDGVDYQAQVEGIENDLEAVADVIEPLFSVFSEISDAPIPALTKQLSVRLPSARFFAFYRPVEKWISSIRAHIEVRDFVPFERVMYWSHFTEQPRGIADLSDKELIEFYHWHHDRIRKIFKGTDKFLELPLEGKGNGKKICEFFGVKKVNFRKIDYKLGHNEIMEPDEIQAEVTE